MSELFEDDPRAVPPPRGSSGRARALIATGVILVLAFFLLTTFATLWTDRLWYADLGFGGVFTKLFWIRTALFLGFGAVMGVVVAVSMLVAYRSRPMFHATSAEAALERYRDAVTPIRVWLLVGVSVIAGIFAGTSATGHWRSFLLWRNGGDFGREDPYFGRDIGFYVFDLPWFHYLVNFVMAAAVVALLAATVVHYLFGGIRLQASRDKLSGAAQVHLSVLLGVFVLAKAADYWLDRFDLVHSESPLMTGLGYTDEHAVLPAKAILAGIAVICAVLFLVNIWRRTWLLPSVGLALLVISAVLLGLIWPAIVQGFQVKPSPDKEKPYLAKNIDSTREAYAIDDEHVTVENYTVPASATASQAAALDAEAASAPLVDPEKVHRLFEESQQARGYYTVADVLDVDHYDIQGKERALVMGVRELDVSGIEQSDQTWNNLHTVYTHGSGVIAAYANHRGLDDARESPEIQWAQGIQTTQNDLVQHGPGDFEERVYFGEKSPSYSVVGRPDGAAPVELDLDRRGAEDGEEDEPTTEYDGQGGVAIGSTWRRLLYAIKFGSTNFLLAERVNENSEVIYNRHPKERIEKVAPWLTLDDDPYPVVVDGRIKWVVDGYTTTDRYPGSERESFETMTDDALQQDTALRTLPTDEINYMRNAVKATVDAYDGTVTLYAWDETDPILQAWRKAFPGTVEPRSEIPESLMGHLRYPEDMFKVQRYQLAKYHVTDVDEFMPGSEWWKVPEDPNSTAGHLLPPYRMFVDEPVSDDAAAQSREVWAITSTFVPNRRNNLAAVMTVNSDPTTENYGKIRVLERQDEQTQGPGQVVSEFKNNSEIANALLAFRGTNGALSYGNLLTVPTTSHGLMYIEPVYAQQVSGSSFPVLAYVLVSYGGNVGYGRTLSEAVASALEGGTEPGGAPTTPPTAAPSPSPSGSPSPTPTAPSGGGTPQELLNEAQQLFERADAAGRSGDFAERERLLELARDKVAEALGQLEQ
ncbi:MAG TPA: UPF0182 family protein [Nocardioides sp.]|uniref:UPF0182 family membrane protein n=1 Tax=Nocardioides sp. TaxID=35761 RepID=UPI002EDA147A